MTRPDPVTVHDLRPTQLTVGFIEVAAKRTHLAALKPDRLEDYLRDRAFPAVIEPAGKPYITDHHHLARAALEAGVVTAWCLFEADFSGRTEPHFWEEMNERLWVHPLDEYGVRHLYKAIPSRLGDLIDDPYRSLAGFVRDAGGYDKTPTAFAEFEWADFFRRSVPVELLRSDFGTAVKAGIAAAASKRAKHLPGYRG